jgi:hypothetical protein
VRTAASLDWDLIKRFSTTEWPAGVLDDMAADVILALSEVRSALPADHRMQPSRLAAGHVRRSGGSRHSTLGGKRLSDATDIFVPGGWAHALAAWQEAQRHSGIGGIGFYVNKWLGSPLNVTPMLHLDCRPDRLLWVCRTDPVAGGDQYIYLHSQPALFFEVMASGFN